MTTKDQFIKYINNRFQDNKKLYSIEVSGTYDCEYFDKMDCLKIPSDCIKFILYDYFYELKDIDLLSDDKIHYGYYSKNKNNLIYSKLYLTDDIKIYNTFIENKKYTDFNIISNIISKHLGVITLDIKTIPNEKLYDISVEIINNFVAQKNFHTYKQKRFHKDIYDFFNALYEKIKNHFKNTNSPDYLYGVYKDMEYLITSIHYYDIKYVELLSVDYYIENLISSFPDIITNRFDALCYLLLKPYISFIWENGEIVECSIIPYFDNNVTNINNIFTYIKHKNFLIYEQIINEHLKNNNNKIDVYSLNKEISDCVNNILNSIEKQIITIHKDSLISEVRDLSYHNHTLNNPEYKLSDDSLIMNIPDDISNEWKIAIRDFYNILMNSDEPDIIDYRNQNIEMIKNIKSELFNEC